MLIQKKLSYSWDMYATLLLKTVFVLVLVGRFLFPFYYNPEDYEYADMLRHVGNGNNLFHPSFLGSADPKAYQLWMYLLQLFPEAKSRYVAALSAGGLCSGMAWFWYKALREITTERKALALSIVLGIHLSLLLIYQFFLTETLLLTLLALATWMTLRAVRMRTFSSFIGASICWILASFTKQTALPIMVMGIGYALAFQPKKLHALLAVFSLFVVPLVPAAWHSGLGLHFFAPFGYAGKEEIFRKSPHISFWFFMADDTVDHHFHNYCSTNPTFFLDEMKENNYRNYCWTNPSFLVNELQPFGTFTSSRTKDGYVLDVDVAKGEKAWEEPFRTMELNHTLSQMINEYEENVIFLFFAYSWPDAWVDGTSNDPTLMQLNFHLRWMWFPCFMLLLFWGPFARLAPRKAWIVLIAFCMTWGFLLQDSSIVEGRYRKPFEPYLLLSAYFLLESLWASADKRRIRLKDFVIDIYFYPFLRRFMAPIFPGQVARQPSSKSPAAVSGH